MDRAIESRLAALPPLSSERVDSRPCKVCGGVAPFFDVVDFQKHAGATPYLFGYCGVPVPYFRCESCYFLFTDFCDDWSHEDFARFIYNDDYLKVDPDWIELRPIRTADGTAPLLSGCEGLRILDYGSGGGQFVEELRRRGFAHAVGYDPFSQPIRPEGLFDIVTCFEVVEHSPRPLETFTEMRDFLSPNGAVVVGQTIQPDNIGEVGGRWWYLAPRNGHVSTYADRTFTTIAANLGLEYRCGPGVYVFSQPDATGPMAENIRRLEPAGASRSIGAPLSRGAPRPDWHGVKSHPKGSYRWTAVNRIVWSEYLPPGRTRIELSYVLEVVKGFAAGCRLEVDGMPVPTLVEPDRISADVTFSQAAIRTIALNTPPPLRPSELGGSHDNRALGLAVLVSV